MLNTVFTEVKSSTLARALGIRVTTSSGKFGGVSATCLTVTRRGNGVKYCVTPQGVLAYSSTGKGNYFTMTQYTTHPKASVFKLPSNATTVTIPSIPSSGNTP